MKKLILTQKKTLIRTAFYLLKWHIDYLRNKKTKPLAVGIFLTNRCNLKCGMCSIWRSQNKAELNVEDIKKIVEMITPGCCYLSFSGGEPLLVKDILEMIKYASGKIPYVHLVSNGLLMDSGLAQEISKTGLSEISLSLDGNEAFHNHIRGAANSYQKVMQAIENLKKNAPHIRIVLNSVIFPGHMDQVRYMVNLAEKLKIYIKVQPVNMHFHFSDAADLPQRIEFEKVDSEELSGLIRYLLGTRHLLNSRLYIKNMANYFKRKSYCPLIRPRCRLPYYFLEVNPHRIVSPCMFATGWQEGLSIEEYIRDVSNKFAALQKKLETCTKCDESMYICYWETMVNIPVTNFIKRSILKR